jgi:hypothetical protein
LYELLGGWDKGDNMISFAAALLVAAGTSSTSTYTPTFPGGLLAWWICSRRKTQEIGGWLLFYYWQLYSGALMTVIFFVAAFQSYVPESFDDSSRYYLFLVSVVPGLVLFCVQLAIATMLISVRTWDLLTLLRWVMCAQIIAGLIGTAIDVGYFSDNLVFDFLTVVPAAIWLAYFFKSRRVAHVFKSHDWGVAVNVMYPPKLATAT